jgi:hypothetical protein
VTNPSEELIEIIEKLGTDIIQCNEKCEGVENNQKEGYYPRALFLEPKNATQVEVLLIGENPGNSSCLEREFYKVLAEKKDSELASFKDCQRIWRSIAKEHDYYQRPKHLLKELGLNFNGILWAEIVFCEKSRSTIPKKTFKKCSSRFLTRITQLLSEGKYVVCLGNTAFQYVRNLPQSNQWKVINVYHPTGSYIFANYFEKETNKTVTERRLRKKIFDEFKKIEESQKSYLIKIEQNRIRTYTH